MTTSSTASISSGVTHTIPCLRYADARVAIDWLVRTFGADARHVYDGPNDTVSHAELWLGAACVMLGSIKPGGPQPTQGGQSSIYVVVPDAATVDALHARAVDAGATIAIGLTDTDYGSHDFACLDPEGNFWSFGTYAPV